LSGSAAGHTTQTDTCSQHTGKGRRGGHEQRRAHSSSVRTACPTASPKGPNSPEPKGSRQGRTAVSSPDNGSAYRAHKHRLACHQIGVKHLFTRPYRPRTNGKAERFIQTLTNDWGRGRLYANSAERTKALGAWLDHYNFTRPHGSLGHKPPGSRLTKAPGNYS
jgi:transposase InsO family protein